MWAKKISTAILIFACVTCAFILITWWWFIHTQYDILLNSILNDMGRMDLKKIITEKYFPLHKYELIKKGSYILPVICLGFPFYLFWKIKSVRRLVENSIVVFQIFFSNVKNTFSSTHKRVKIMFCLLLLFVFTRGIYYTLSYEIIYDEAWNYNYFLSKNPLYSLIAYNNYPLHNIITGIFVKIFGSSLWVLRLPSILMSLLLATTTFFIAKKIFCNDWIALLCSTLLGMLPVFTFYSFLSRGVLFEVFFASIVTYFLFNITRNKKPSHQKLLFIAFLNACGMMAMLSHIYFIFLTTFALFLFSFFQKKIRIKTIFFYNIYSIIFIALFFLPMILTTGFSLGINAAVAKGNSYLALHHLPFHCYSDLNGASVYSFYFLILVCVYAIFIYRKSVDVFLYILALVIITSPLLINIFTGIFPPERAMAFQIIGVVIIIGFIIKRYSFYIKNTYFNYAFYLIMVVFLSIKLQNHPYINWSKKLDIEVKSVAEILLKYNANSIYSESSQFKYFFPGIIYYYNLQGKKIDIYTSDMASVRYLKERDNNTRFVVSDTIYQNAKALFISDECKLFFIE